MTIRKRATNRRATTDRTVPNPTATMKTRATALILIQDGNSILVATSPDDIFFRDIESSPAL